LDDVTIKNLELLSSTYEGSEKYSLLNILDNTETAGGSRLLRSLVTNPIKDKTQLQWRLNNIEHYMNDEMIERVNDGGVYKENTTKRIHQILNNVRDIPKLVSTMLYKKILPNTFIKLRATLRIFFENKFLLDELKRL
jgi:DNA mismatch repair protein MutS